MASLFFTPGVGTGADISPQLEDVQISSGSEGNAISRIFGRSRLSGQLIWATDFKEVVTEQEVGGKGVGGETVESFKYYASFAFAFCEGSAETTLGRIWIDGKVINLNRYTIRFYPGTDTQSPDPWIETIEGSGSVPSFRGVAYLVFEELPLADFGNRIPQVTAEIIKPIATTEPFDLENSLRGVSMIPSSGEFAYGTQVYLNEYNPAEDTEVLNLNNTFGIPDAELSLDQLQEQTTNLASVMLVVSWFGSDLRMGECELKPKIEFENKIIIPHDWKVSGIERQDAPLLPREGSSDNPIYGGTPDDQTIFDYIQLLNSRGISVTFCPFILMEPQSGDNLPSPYGGIQGDFPWRGRITCTPAPGRAGTPDKTSAVNSQVTSFFGSASVSDVPAGSDNLPDWTGSDSEFGYRRMILHYARLCQLAGGVDSFLIGSELRGITRVRSSQSNFPAVTQLVNLAADVKSIVGSSTDVGYAADWTEYNNYRPEDGSGDVYFNLDPLWSSPNIDFVGIDNYLPLSDYKDGDEVDIRSREYLKSNVEAGEFYDYFYASETDRINRNQSPITDGSGKPWTFRQKDIRNWWTNTHVNRPGGTESGGNTSWVPQSKPVRFIEYGCPAIDKGSNQPNVFFDPRSSESQTPYFSTGQRDDGIQRLFNEALLEYWDDTQGNNPVSSVYGGRMIDLVHSHAWTWDARPYPQFPYLTNVWSDYTSYDKGHWLNGRLGVVPLSEVVKDIVLEAGVPEDCVDVTGLFGASAPVRGFAIKGVTKPRDALETLGRAYLFDAFESEGKIKFILKNRFISSTVDVDKLVTTSRNASGYSLTRGQETELPDTFKIDFLDESNDYQQSSVDATKQVGRSKKVEKLELSVVLEGGYVKSLAESLIQEAWLQREKGSLTLPPSMIRFDPGDNLILETGARDISLSIVGIDTGASRAAECQAYDASIYSGTNYESQNGSIGGVTIFGLSRFEFMDIPLITGEELSPHAPRIAGFQNPWPGAINVYKDNGSGGFDLHSQVNSLSGFGRLVADFYSGPLNRWDNANDLFVEMDSNTQLLSASEASVLDGANALAIKKVTNAAEMALDPTLPEEAEWEIVQYVTAELIDERKYKLSQLLRGQLGSEHAMGNPIPSGARVVVLKVADLYVLNSSINDRLVNIDYRYGPASYQQDDFRYRPQTFAARAVGLRPYAPVQIRGTKNGNDVDITWVRRTRFGGDSWEAAEVPLNEESESYEIEILNGSSVVRTLQSTIPSVSYSQADQISDFGSVQNQYDVKVYQISGSVGRGTPGIATIYP